MVWNRFIFIIPLKPKAAALDWSQVTNRLQDTLISVLRQSEVNFQIILASVERPEIPEMDDPRIVWLPTDTTAIREAALKAGRVFTGGSDKRFRVLFAGDYLRENNLSEAYIMPLDADDLVQIDLVRTVLESGGTNGYYLDRGYVFDENTQKLRKKDFGFYGSCGSSIIFHCRGEDLPKWRRDGFSYFGKMIKHTTAPMFAEQQGRPLAILPLHGAVYLIGGQDSLQLANRGGTRRIEVSDFADQDASELLMRDFGFDLSRTANMAE